MNDQERADFYAPNNPEAFLARCRVRRGEVFFEGIDTNTAQIKGIGDMEHENNSRITGPVGYSSLLGISHGSS